MLAGIVLLPWQLSCSFTTQNRQYVGIVYVTFYNSNKMIVSNLSNSSRWRAPHPLFKNAFDYVKNNDLLHAELGRIVIDGDNLFINNVNPECASREQVLELHRDYIDVHIPA